MEDLISTAEAAEIFLFKRETVEDFKTRRQNKNPKTGISRTLLSNLPQEILSTKRFFPACINREGKKVPMIDGWQKLGSLMTADEAAKKGAFVGFLVSAKDNDDDPWLLADFDHVLDANGNFVDSEAERCFYDFLNLFDDCYVEKSVSGNGLHILAKPSKDKFGKISGSGNGRLYFDKEKKIMLELFYKTEGRYCFMTGDLFECEVGAKIPAGENVDILLQSILDEINRKCLDDYYKAEAYKFETKYTAADESPADSEYDIFRAQIMLQMLATIDHTQLEYGRWLAIQTSCKNIGVDYADVDRFNSAAGNGDNYNAAQNWKYWQKPIEPEEKSFTIRTLHGIAKRFGYREAEARRQWYQLHPEALFNGGHSDLTNAGRLEKFFRNDIRWLTDDERWLIYADGVWTRRGEKNTCLLPFAKNLRGLLMDCSNKLEDENEKKTAQKIIADFASQRKISAAFTMLKAYNSILITADDLDKYPELLNVKNGVVNLQTGELMDAAPELLLTQQASVAYDCRADSTAIEKFFADIMPDEGTRHGLLRWLGYCLTGEVREEKFLLWRGSGANGKGVLHRLMAALLANYATALPRGALLLRKYDDGNSHTAALNSLAGSRFAMCEEISQSATFDSAMLKNLTGSDLQVFREMYHEFKTCTPTAKLNMSANFTPKFENADDVGIIRRLLVAPFDVSFTGDRADPTLKARLLQPENLRGLLKILVDEAQVWYQDGLIISEHMKVATRDNLDANDFISDFLADFCELGSGEIPRRALLDKIREKCIQAHRFNDSDICKMLEKRGVGYKKTRSGRVFTGIRFLSNNDFDGVPVDEDDIPNFD